MGKEIISTDKAPKPSGVYSQAIKSQGFIVVAGQIPFETTED
jgi:enamine deaminase RidA (YjgF/YER057c/UK114 family)